MAEPADTRRPEALSAAHESYLLHDRKEIAAQLKALERARAMATVYFEGGEPCLTSTFLSHDADRDEVTLDGGGERAAELAVLAKRELAVVAFLDGLKLQFHAPGGSVQAADGGPVLKLPFPRTMLRLQRRQHFRVRTPILRSPVCHVPPDTGRAACALRVADLSVGGLALALRPGEPRLGAGDFAGGCVLELPGAPAIPVSLDVRHANDFMNAAGKPLRTCGCRFVGLPGPAQTQIQRYILAVERERARLVG